MLHHSTINDQATPPAAAPVQRPAFLEIMGLRSFRYLWLGNGLSDMGEKILSMPNAWMGDGKALSSVLDFFTKARGGNYEGSWRFHRA